MWGNVPPTVRHADPAVVVVRLQAGNDGTIELEVEDDGRGFDLAEVRERGDRFGLIGMRERCGAVDGRCALETEPGSGTRIRAVVPRRSERTWRSGEAPPAGTGRSPSSSRTSWPGCP